MKLKGAELAFLGLALAALFFAAGYFTGRGAAGDIDVTVEKRVMAPSDAGTEGLVNINTATRVELMALPGIGEALADRIIDYRESHGLFTCTEELLSVPGIGEALYDAVEDSVTV